jgi:hypothetical protein
MKKAVWGFMAAVVLTAVLAVPRMASANIVWATVAPTACAADIYRLMVDPDYFTLKAWELMELDYEAFQVLQFTGMTPWALADIYAEAINEVGCY